MYEAFYGLHEKPFALSPDPKYLFLSESHREVLGHLIYGIEQGEGFMAITGEVGTGKTTLCRTLLERLGAESEVAFLFNPTLSPLELLKAIHTEFGLGPGAATRSELTEALNRFLLQKKEEGRRVLIIVDEAQNLSAETLEQIRLLSNLETSTSKLIQIVLLGQPELDAKLDTRELRQLRQRISVWWHLGPLSATETREYVRHRLRIAAGVERPLFEESALRLVHRLAAGVPRVINILCDRCLLAGYADGVAGIDRDLVRRVAAEVRPRHSQPERRPLLRVAAVAAGALLLAGALVWALLGWETGLPAISARRPDPAPRPFVAAAVQAAPPPVAAAAETILPDPIAPPIEATAPVEPDVVRLERPGPALEEPEAPGLAPPTDGPLLVLDAVLPLMDGPAANAATADAALEAWRLPASGAAALPLDEALGLLAARGLALLRVEAPGLAPFEGYDLPVIVQIRAPDDGSRAALLRTIDAGQAELQGLVPGETLRIPTEELAERRTGAAFTVWRDFEGLPGLMEAGDRGKGVEWLQSSLGELGFYGGELSGRFEAETESAVRAFQASVGLAPDGRVGPRTKIHLYAALPGYATPVLMRSAVGLAGAPGKGSDG